MSGTRRTFLKYGIVVAGGAGLGLLALARFRQKPVRNLAAYGPLSATRDETTGLQLLCLPDGFRYRSMSWAGEILDDGYPVPALADGMGVVADYGGRVTLIRNHELRGSSGPIGDPEFSWDVTGGGTTSLVFNTESEQLESAIISLGGTLNNCAGGVTPWGTWLSCEEAPYTPAEARYGLDTRQLGWSLRGARKKHGYVFEVPANGIRPARPIVSMGQFYHEAAAVDPGTGIVYMTEDQQPEAGYYRFVPDQPGVLAAGGRLQMMRVENLPDLRGGLKAGQQGSASWVDIDDPDLGHTPGTHDGRGVVRQGLAAGGSAFVGLEGCVWRDGSVFFASKSGGRANCGQVFRFDARAQTVELLWVSAGRNDFNGPDNLAMNPRGDLVLCEDRVKGGLSGQRMSLLNSDGQLLDICALNAAVTGHHGSHDLARTIRQSEWAGACFSADGRWLFANIYNPGVTVAITGPWAQAPVAVYRPE